MQVDEVTQRTVYGYQADLCGAGPGVFATGHGALAGRGAYGAAG